MFSIIQASNWNANRLTFDRANVLTEKLLSDLRLETRNIMRVYRYHEDVLANAERVLQALTGEKEASNSDLLIYANESLVPALRLRIAIMDTELADIKGSFIDGPWQRFHDDWAEGNAAAQTAPE